MNKLLIVVGVPGQGKSTLCKKFQIKYIEENIGSKSVILSTDNLITTPIICSYRAATGVTGRILNNIKQQEEYTWSPDSTSLSHKLNQIKCREFMKRQYNLIIIDNTNLTFSEIEPYVDYAIEYNYEIEFIKPDTPWMNDAQELFKKNEHNVPIETIERMLQKFNAVDFSIFNAKIKQKKENYDVQRKST